MPPTKTESAEERLRPYQLPFPAEAATEIVVPNAIPADEREWVPQAENVWFRPLCLSASNGYWMNLLRVRKSGVLSRHRHTQPVHGWVLRGKWHYLEHDWVATEGSYVYEPPGETHTLVVPEDCTEMITYFQVNGAMIYVDPWGGDHRLRGRLHQNRDVPQALCTMRSRGGLRGHVYSLAGTGKTA